MFTKYQVNSTRNESNKTTNVTYRWTQKYTGAAKTLIKYRSSVNRDHAPRVPYSTKNLNYTRVQPHTESLINKLKYICVFVSIPKLK